MKKNYSNLCRALIGLISPAFFIPLSSTAQTSVTYTFTGAVQQFTVPTCVGSMTIEARGAQGASGSAIGGNGGTARGILNLPPAGQLLDIYVGGQNGYNGGGAGSTSGGNGGGASDVRLNPGGTLNDRLIVGAGGGGGGGTNGSATTAGGGVGGGSTLGSNYSGGTAGYAFATHLGTNGGNAGGTGGVGNGSNNGGSGGGGGYTSGGGGGSNGTYGTGANGVFGIGGAGGGATGSGGGGGGYYGGGGSSGGSNSNSGGGGGSSYTGTLTSPSFTAGNQTGNGIVIITYSFNGPGVTATASPTAICSGNSATLTGGSVNSYTWQPVGNFSGSTSQSVVVSPTVTTIYSVSGTNSVNCVSSAVITVTVNTVVPAISASSNTNSTCYGNTIAVSATGALSYTFSNGISNGVAFLPSSGVNNYTVTGGNGCGTSSAVVTVTISSLPVTASATSTLICAGQPATLTATGANNFTWTPASSSINTSSTYFVNPSVTTTYTVVGTTGPCGGVNTIVVTTKANPTLNVIASSTNICSGNSVTLTAVGNATSYVWSPGSQTGSSIITSPSQLTLYTATGTNTNNCSASAQQVVLVSPNPTIAIAVSDPVVCAGGPSTLTASGATTYSWATANTASVLVYPTVNTTYSVTGSYSTGCFSTASAIVSVFVPSIAVSGNTSTCLGVNIGISASGASSYTWTNNGAQAQGITVNPTANTVYTVIGSVADQVSGISCNTTNTLEVTVNPNPTVTATSNRTGNAICPGESAVLTAEGASASGTYTWTGGSGAIVGISNTVTPIASQNYTVTGKDANGCKGTGNIQIIVTPCTNVPGVRANAASLIIYPNPSSGSFNIFASQAITLQIVNELGQQVRTITLNGTSNTSATVSNLAHGIYFIMGNNENGSVREKVIITH